MNAQYFTEQSSEIKLLISFVSAMQNEFPHVIFRFEEDPEENMFRIWHTDYHPDEEQNFFYAMGRIIKNEFVPAGFLNFYLEHNVAYSKALNKTSLWVKASQDIPSNVSLFTNPACNTKGFQMDIQENNPHVGKYEIECEPSAKAGQILTSLEAA